MQSRSHWILALAFLTACRLAPAQERPDIVWNTPSSATALAFSPDGTTLAASFYDDQSKRASLALFRVSDGSIIRAIDPTMGKVMSLDFSPDGTRLAAGGSALAYSPGQDYAKVRIFRVSDGAVLLSITDHLYPAKGVKFLPNGTELVVLAKDGRPGVDRILSVYRASTGARLRWYGAGVSYEPEYLESLALSPDGTVVAASLEGTARLWRTSDLMALGDLAARSVAALAFSPDGTILASGDYASSSLLRLWRTTDWTLIRMLLGHATNQMISSVAFSHDGLVLGSTSLDNTIRFWDPATGAPLKVYKSTTPGRLAFSPDGAYFAYISGQDRLAVARYPYAPFAGTSMTVADSAGPIGSDVTVSARLTSGGASLCGKTLTFTIDGDQGTAVSDSTGTASLTYRVPKRSGAGPRAIAAAFAGDPGFGPSSAAGTLMVTRADTFVNVIDRTGPLGSSVFLTGYLYQSSDRSPIGGRSLSFALDGTSIGSAATDAEGRATLAYMPPSGSAGLHWIHVGWAGDVAYAYSAAVGRLEVTKGVADVWVLPRTAARGTQTYLRAYLRSLPDYQWLDGRTVGFSLNGTPLGSAVTEAGLGRASLLIGIPPDMALGGHAIVAAFSGDLDYAADTGTATLTITP